MEELEMMRQQLNALKQQLNSQSIINRKLMEKIMKRKSSWLNKLVNIEIISIPFLCLIISAGCAIFGISQWFAVVYAVLCIADVITDWYTVRIPKYMFGTASIIEFKKYLLRQKRYRFIQVAIMLPLSLIWISAYVYSMFVYGNLEYFNSHPHEAHIFGLVNALIANIAGIIGVLVIYFKMQRTNDALLSDINDLESPDTEDLDPVNQD